MKITFIYPDFGYHPDKIRKFKTDKFGNFSEGIASLSSVLKKAGHDVSLIHIVHQISKEELIKSVKKHSPDLIFFSFITHMVRYVQEWISFIREAGIKTQIACGGVNPTIDPQGTINLDGVNIICIGEGEEAILELVKNLESKKDLTKIKNLWVKKGDKIYKNSCRPLIKNLDEIPFADIKIFNLSKLKPARNNSVTIMLSRGCPYNCTYCSNHIIKSRYPDKANYARFRSVDNSIKYLKNIIKEYPFIETIEFYDNILPLKKEWFMEFSKKYKKEINLPFQCRARANLLDKETVAALKEAGCYCVHLGIESGNDYIRNDILNRNMKEEDIINGFKLCNEIGLETISYNMVGLPFENMKTMLDTIKINAKAKPNYSERFIFYPYPNTKLHEICCEKGYLTNKEFDTYEEGTTIRQPSVTEGEVLFAYKYFKIFIKSYKICFKLPKGFEKILDMFFLAKKPYFIFNKGYDLMSLFLNKTLSFLHNTLPGLYSFLRSFYIRKSTLRKMNARKV